LGLYFFGNLGRWLDERKSVLINKEVAPDIIFTQLRRRVPEPFVFLKMSWVCGFLNPVAANGKERGIDTEYDSILGEVEAIQDFKALFSPMTKGFF